MRRETGDMSRSEGEEKGREESGVEEEERETGRGFGEIKKFGGMR